MKFAASVLASLCCLSAVAAEPKYASHPPRRPLPTVSERPLAKGPAKFVDVARGDDEAAGSEKAPWKTLAHAFRQLQPGDTLYVRAGTYYERTFLTRSGTAEAPITIRAYPGESVIVDGG